MDTMGDLLAALPLGDVGDPGPLSQAVTTDTVAAALFELSGECDVKTWVSDGEGCRNAVYSGLRAGAVIETCSAIAALSEGAYAEACCDGDSGIPDTTNLSSVAIDVVTALLETAAAEQEQACAEQTPKALPSEHEVACLEAVARMLCSSGLDCREDLAEAGAVVGARAAEAGLHAAELALSESDFDGLGANFNQPNRDTLLQMVGWAVHCCYSVILGGGGFGDLLSVSANVGLRAALAFLVTIPKVSEDEGEQLTEAATTALRLTALVLREDSVCGGQLHVAQLREIGHSAAQLPVPPLPWLDPPCEFELMIDTIRSAARARVTCAQFLARR